MAVPDPRGGPAPAARAGRPRIAIVGPTHPYKGGIAQHTTELAHRLARRGHDVWIESWSAQYPARLYPGQQRVDAPEMEPFPATGYPLSWWRPDGWVRLGRRLRRRADAVVVVVVTPIQAPAYLGILAGLGRAGRRAAGPAVLALCHNVLPHERRRLDEPLIRAVLRRAGAVLVHTDAEATRAAALTAAPVRVAAMAPHLWTAPSRRVHAADAPAAPDRAGEPAGQATGEATSALGGPRRRLLFFGLVRPYKGLDVLLRALAAGPPDVALTVAGEFWGGQEATQALVAELGLADRVELRPGYVDAADVPALFAAADALVLPYRAGTASQNVDLAHLHGLPVVATSVGTLPAAVSDGVDGLLVPPGDPAALAAALRRLYEPGVLTALAAKVRPPDTAGGWERYLDTLLEAIEGQRRVDHR
ncbi:glycosyltransferase [Frankia sp. CNm7]|uniref:Glycosyltransferase n=1 Tax=Frankia nepalensis TaxID=1836974 RepID=A0A937RR87_9ACTN|nr:glycosyltransferase [Frankia nepalensis]MBL7496850.1 glycosyltransferase [Frankia nepalensis]MBL7514674.1 glycosyltransferase [Frankia nepalensis]MBL7524581.1 glycosyltransferase [Frankia nepalensis]MBL7630491.1 glycosyltransferase [Frankia nepalensis]